MTRPLLNSTDSHSLFYVDRPEVLTTLTQDEGKLIAAIHDIKRGGESDLQTGIQVAQVGSLLSLDLFVLELMLDDGGNLVGIETSTEQESETEDYRFRWKSNQG